MTAMRGSATITHMESTILKKKLMCRDTPFTSRSMKKPMPRYRCTILSVIKKNNIMPRGGTIAIVSHTFIVCTLERSASIVKGT